MSSKQKIFHRQRRYNQWVANETLEDFALRYTGKKARKWSNQRVANTALGIVSFLALEAIGGAITLNYGFTNAFWAITAVCLLIFVTGLPICYFAAKAGIDIDLLTRGAGFGYIGSTITSLIYASFTFIFFALEAAIMSMAIHVLSNIPLSVCYLLSSLLVIPLVTHGIARISVFQLWSQPLWLVLQFLPLAVILSSQQTAIVDWTSYAGLNNEANEFNLLMFGAATAVIFPLLAQNGEQVDFLRFLPKQQEGSKKWWASVILAGPGWVFIGFIKLLIGSFLAVLALQHGVDVQLADDPSHMYQVAFGYITTNNNIALILTCLFVILSQLKINVTNAYAGSIAWSNFFSRITHSHPGRVVWLFFNVAIALLLMELGLYHAFEDILITYSALVLGWIGSLVADLTLNRSLGLRPKEIQFKRSHLYDINPVGVISMLLASSVGICGQYGVFGQTFQALCPFVVLLIPFISAPLIAYITQGRYYLLRPENETLAPDLINAEQQARCGICENDFDIEDMSHCPFYQQAICSLCCAIDSRCNDHCRPQGNIKQQTFDCLSYLFPQRFLKQLNSNIGHFALIFTFISLLNLILLSTVFHALDIQTPYASNLVFNGFWQVFFLLMIITGVLSGLYVLADSNKKSAFKEAHEQMQLLQQEILSHEITEQQLQRAKDSADAANQAKSRYLGGISHELRTPLNTVYGYAQLIERNSALPENVRKSAMSIGKNAEHITDIIEGLLEIAKIEARRVDFLNKEEFKLSNLITPLVDSFTMQAEAKGIAFNYHCDCILPMYVATDVKRLRQILMNLLSNAIKFTQQGSVTLSVSYRNQVAKFSVKDTGLGIDDDNLQCIFDPFERVLNNDTLRIQGTGLGLSISRLLAELLGGDIAVSSQIGQGSTFTFSVLLPAVIKPTLQPVDKLEICGYEGRRRTLLIVDNEACHRAVIDDLLTPLGFQLLQASNASQALKTIQQMTIDLFLLDVSMPEMNGWTLAQKITDSEHAAPIIMLSGNAIEDQREQMQGKLHQFYLIKPVIFDDLLDKLGQALRLNWLYHNNSEEAGEVTERHPVTKQARELLIPPKDQLIALKQAAQIGYIKGVELTLQNIKHLDEKYPDFTQHIDRELLNFNFPAIINFIEEYE